MAQQPVAPVRSTERLKSLDTLRGFALLGILVPNIVAFGWPAAASEDISILGDAPINQLGYAITTTVFLGKFMFLFAMLFGAGVIVYAHKYDGEETSFCANCKYDLSGHQPGQNCPECNSTNRRRTKLSTGAMLWHRRCAILLAFGLIHAYLFWYGDILTWYAVAGLTLLWWVRRLSIPVQLILAVASYAISTLVFLALTALGIWAVQQGHITEQEMGASAIAPDNEIAAYLGTWFDAFKARGLMVLMMHLVALPLYMPTLWAIMMLGMALTRTGILTGHRSLRFYLIAGFAGIALGGAMTGLAFATLGGEDSFGGGMLMYMLAPSMGIPLSLGYAMFVIAATKTNALNFITTPLAAVGRMALTNYFLHTLLCTSLFYGYGWGLGYFGKIQYPGLWYVIGAVWVVNIVFSILWLKVFRFGPIEWAWRCMTYGKLLPIMHAPSTPTPAPTQD